MGNICGHLDGKAGLADAARAGQIDEPNIRVPQQLGDRRPLARAPDEAGQGSRQWRAKRLRIPGWERNGPQEVRIGGQRVGHGRILP